MKFENYLNENTNLTNLIKNVIKHNNALTIQLKKTPNTDSITKLLNMVNDELVDLTKEVK